MNTENGSSNAGNDNEEKNAEGSNNSNSEEIEGLSIPKIDQILDNVTTEPLAHPTALIPDVNGNPNDNPNSKSDDAARYLSSDTASTIADGNVNPEDNPKKSDGTTENHQSETTSTIADGNNPEVKADDEVQSKSSDTILQSSVSDSQDEDMLLRWDDDDQEQGVILEEIGGEKVNLESDIAVEGNQSAKMNMAEESVLESNDNTDSAKEDIPKTIDEDTLLAVNSKSENLDCDGNNDNELPPNEPDNVAFEDINLSNDGKDTCAMDVETDVEGLTTSCEDILLADPACEVNDIESDVATKINVDKEVIGDVDMDNIPVDIEKEIAVTISEGQDNNKLSIIDENKIVQDIKDKISEALVAEELIGDNNQKSSVCSQEDDQENITTTPEAVDANDLNIIDGNKIIQDINDKIATVLDGEKKSQDKKNADQGTESCDKNMELEQRLEVLAESIETNSNQNVLDIDIDSSKMEDKESLDIALNKTNEGAVETPISDMDIDETIDDQVDNNENPNESEKDQNIDALTVSDKNVSFTESNNVKNIDDLIKEGNYTQKPYVEIDAGVNLNKNRDTEVSEVVQNVGKGNVEKEPTMKIGSANVLKLDQMNKEEITTGPMPFESNPNCKDNIEKSSEIDTNINAEAAQIDKNQSPEELEKVQDIESSVKEDSVTNDTVFNTDLKTKPTKEKNENTEPENKDKKAKDAEMDSDDDLVEIIETCNNFIDLSSQSPLSFENELDRSETPKENLEKPGKNTPDTSNDHSTTKSPKSFKTDHRLKPDVMLEIPMHNLKDVDDMDSSLNMDSETIEADRDTVVDVQKDIKEEFSPLDTEINLNLNHEMSEKVLQEIRNEIDNLNLEIKNEPGGMDITEIKEETIHLENLNTGTEGNLFIDSGAKDMPPSSGFRMRMSPDTAGGVPGDSDSLGLLAESSRARRNEDIDEDDDDDDYDLDDESSNQMTAEHSEDSNQQQSELDPKEREDKTDKDAFQFQSSDNAESCEVVDGTEVITAIEENSADVNTSTIVETNERQAEQGDPAVTEMDVETVQLFESTEKGTETVEKDAISPSKDKNADDKSPQQVVVSPRKSVKLEIAKPRVVFNIVELEESSSEEDTQDIKQPDTQSGDADVKAGVDADVTNVNIPTEIEIMSSGGNTSQIVTKEREVVIQVPRPPALRRARLNTSEVTIKTAHATEPTLVIPEKKMSEPSQSKPKVGLEVYNLDSDDDDIVGSGEGPGSQKLTALELDAALSSGRCLRRGCTRGTRGARGGRGERGALDHYCDECATAHYMRTQNLVEGIKNMTPLMELDMEKLSQDLVEISDSDSDSEAQEPKETIGEAGAKLLEDNLADIINSMWIRYKMDASLKDAKELLDVEIDRLNNESKEIHKMLNECQVATDRLRSQLYSTFEPTRQELPAISIYNTPEGVYVSSEGDTQADQQEVSSVKHGKRRLSVASVPPPKRPAIPLGYTPLEQNVSHMMEDQSSMLVAGEYSNRYDDDKDISVVQLSAESAPSDLPPPGEPKRPALRVGMQVYAMRNAFGSWSRARILESMKIVGPATQFPNFRVKFEHKVKNPCKVLSARCLAYIEPADVRLTIGTRVIALFKESTNQARSESYYSGIIAEIPNPVNNYRYLVFFDDGYAQYASHAHTRIVCACTAPVWEEVHPFSREFVRNYLCAYPERPMVRLHAGQRLNTEWNGKWWDSRVVLVDASLVQVHFEEDNRTEWIYRGSTRLEPLFLELQAAVRHRGRHLLRSKGQIRTNMPYVEYTRSYEQDRSLDAQQEELRLQRAVAKKSTSNSLALTSTIESGEPLGSRVVYYTPRSAVRPYKMVAHTCGPKCRRSDVLTLRELRSYNPLAKPLLSGWERQLVRHRGAAAVLYRAPCGRRLRHAGELQRYLAATRCAVPIDLFDFNPDTHCLAEYVVSTCNVGKKDLSHGKENVPVPCVNTVDDSLPEFCAYNTERTPTAGVPLNLDPDFLCGCDCTDDCEDKSKCACWKMTLEGARTIGLEGNVGYEYKRLPEPLPSGIYECNVRCKCKSTCLNRVAQHPLQLKLQVFKTPNRGWGIRALNDVPKGAFLCVYAGNLLTDATANLDGLNEGDEYLAELDYIEVVEQMKEGYEEDVPEADKVLDKKDLVKSEDKSSSSGDSSSEEDERVSKDEEQDHDFRPGYITPGVAEFSKHLRKRGKKKAAEEEAQREPQRDERAARDGADDDCITISDDEEMREPSRFTVQAGMGANEYVPKYKSVRAHFGEDEACYIMDAKVQGNIGRYLNHSCAPNVFVQNVFVDTHDPRFPWVAFFALNQIRAGTELTWNYNYDVGSVPGKVLYCYCGAKNCRRRLL